MNDLIKLKSSSDIKFYIILIIFQSFSFVRRLSMLLLLKFLLVKIKIKIKIFYI